MANVGLLIVVFGHIGQRYYNKDTYISVPTWFVLHSNFKHNKTSIINWVCREEIWDSHEKLLVVHLFQMGWKMPPVKHITRLNALCHSNIKQFCCEYKLKCSQIQIQTHLFLFHQRTCAHFSSNSVLYTACTATSCWSFFFFSFCNINMTECSTSITPAATSLKAWWLVAQQQDFSQSRGCTAIIITSSYIIHKSSEQEQSLSYTALPCFPKLCHRLLTWKDSCWNL